MQLAVKGMTCDHCVRAVTDAVEGLDGVTAVSVDLGAETVTVEGQDVDADAVRHAIVEAGYEPAGA